MTIPRTPPERRSFGRRQAFEHAIVRIPGRPPIRCTLLNISDSGAFLDFAEQVHLPFSFRLVWEGSNREEQCELRHQNGARVGVNFVPKTETVAARRPGADSSLDSASVTPWHSGAGDTRR
jgi:hypothetical protein